MRALSLVALSLIVGCSGESASPASCVPGAVVECPCGGGARGVQTCASNGTFGACTCSVDASVTAPDTASPDTAIEELDSSVADTSVETPVETGGACPSSTGCVLRVPIPTSTFGAMGVTVTICPEGPKPTASPPQCILEIDLGKVMWTHASGSATVSAGGRVPMRVVSLPVVSGTGARTVWALGGLVGCPPEAFATTIDVNITMTSASSAPRPGCDAATVVNVASNPNAFKSATRACSGLAFGKDGVAAAIQTEANNALRSATTSATCKTL